ncbi:MAG: type I DNA topoisomerase [Nitrospinae bacterium]|nr:type I DNA topoisomerase [Nitrospinota bacterium]
MTEKTKTKSAKKAQKCLVIVESPAKASTIRKYLGPSFEVKASVGHIRDLPKSKLGVDVDNGFKMQFVTIKGKADVVKDLKAAAKKADVVYLAPDPDREGEAIAQHIFDILNSPDKIYRIMFNEITKKAVLAAVENPRKINASLVHAQQARRVLDRLVGYKLSPLLWSKVRSGLSAGRVQSVAMRILVDREKEIEAFVPKEYWSIKSILSKRSDGQFEAKLHQIDGAKFEINNEADATAAVEGIKGEKLSVASVELKDRKRNAPAPFITSTLQQAASQRYRLRAGKTMRIAQKLYEGMDVGGGESVGLITYMRTDSTRIADDAIAEVRGYIGDTLGKEYLPEKPNSYQSRTSAQEAHEAIRPTSVARTPESVKKYLAPEEYKLYDLIWKRFVASQMNPAIIATLTVDVAAGRYTLRATGSQMKFYGFLKVYGEDEEKDKEPENRIPALEKGDVLNLDEITPNQHFTQPPPRYTEAALIRELEEKGIGRPSTYATIMDTIQSRDYAELEDRKLKPTQLGRMITDLLSQHFPTIMDLQFTAQMEGGLDKVEEGNQDWVGLLNEFYAPFAKALEAANVNIVSQKEEIKTEHVCEKCGSPMVIKHGRYGKFLACSGYPACKNAKPLNDEGSAPLEPVKTGDKCPTCGKDMVLRSGRFGKFIACEDYPTCKTTKAVTMGIKCPKDCGGEIVERRTKGKRFFYGCSSYPKCDFVSWEKPIKEPCPKCGHPFLVYAAKKKGETPAIKCPKKECDYTRELPQETAEAGVAE